MLGLQKPAGHRIAIIGRQLMLKHGHGHESISSPTVSRKRNLGAEPPAPYKIFFFQLHFAISVYCDGI
jgi:hypothetical protein